MSTQLVGYARVSTFDQTLALQQDALQRLNLQQMLLEARVPPETDD